MIFIQLAQYFFHNGPLPLKYSTYRFWKIPTVIVK